MIDFTKAHWVEARSIHELPSPDKYLWKGRNTEEEYLDVLLQLPRIKELAEQGISLFDICQSYPDLANAVHIFFDGTAIYVNNRDGILSYASDGRHRIWVAQKHGLSVPVFFYRES